MPENKYFCSAMICISSLTFIVGGAFWYFDIYGDPFSIVFILPAIIILFGIGIACVGFKVISCEYPAGKKEASTKDRG